MLMPEWAMIILLYVLGYFFIKHRNKIEQDYLLKERKKKARLKMFEDGAGI